MIYQTEAEIITNVEVAPSYYKMTLNAPKIARQTKPGQFLHLRVHHTTAPLLRRPFSISSIKRPEKIEILYKVVGQGTNLLTRYVPSESINIIGPLGNGFDLTKESNKTILIGGGIGIAPMVGVAEYLYEKGRKFSLLMGVKTEKDILCQDLFRKAFGIEPLVATENGSYGYKGLVTELLHSIQGDHIIACGPWGMLKEVAKIAMKNMISCQVSLESHMGCGVGACLGCVIKIRQPNSQDTTQYLYKRVCVEGPVFDATEVIW